MRMSPLPLTLVGLVALASVLGGCGGHSGPASDGPLSSATSMHGRIPSGDNCVPPGHAQTFGDQTFTNYGKAMVILDRVVLLNPHNERLIGSYAVPGTLLVGVVFWPIRNPQTQPAWKDRQPVHGFRLPPGKSFNMVLGVVAIAPGRASSQGMVVYYHDSSGRYVARNNFAMTIAATKLGCEQP